MKEGPNAPPKSFSSGQKMDRTLAAPPVPPGFWPLCCSARTTLQPGFRRLLLLSDFRGDVKGRRATGLGKSRLADGAEHSAAMGCTGATGYT